MITRIHLSLLAGALLCALAIPIHAEDVKPAADAAPAVTPMYPVAIFPFKEIGTGVKDYGGKISDLLFASIAANPDIMLVDRAELEKVLSEHHLNMTGAVNPSDATQMGQLTGAKILVVGSVFETGRNLTITAKIIGTETTKVKGESVKGNTTDDLGGLTDQLAEKVAKNIIANAGTLIAKPADSKDALAELKAKLADAKKPAVYICLNERHVGEPTIDPAAQTEMMLYCKEIGFNVVDNSNAVKPAPIRLVGEGFSEFATKVGDMVSVRGRLEVKAIDPATDQILAVDRQTVIVVGVSEQVAGKTALERAAAMIAQRLLPKLVQQPVQQ